MGLLLNLIANENMKIYRRMRTWILVILIVAIVLLTGILMKTHEAPPSSNWRTALQAQTTQLQQELTQVQGKHVFMPARATAGMEIQIKKNQYEISHNIAPAQYTAWSFTSTIEQRAIGVLLTVFVAIVAGDIVAGEFSSGTIKLLLTRPQTRARILLSKYVATLIFAVFMMAVTIVASLVIGGVLYGFANASQTYVYMDASGHVQQMGMIPYIFTNYAFNSVSMLMTVTIAFMISTIFRSSAIAIAISILSLFIGNTLVAVLSSYSWDKYILFANTDLSQYVFNGPLISGMTMTFSIIVLVVYFIVMNGLSWFLFKKRDVALT